MAHPQGPSAACIPVPKPIAPGARCSGTNPDAGATSTTTSTTTARRGCGTTSTRSRLDGYANDVLLILSALDLMMVLLRGRWLVWFVRLRIAGLAAALLGGAAVLLVWNGAAMRTMHMAPHRVLWSCREP